MSAADPENRPSDFFSTSSPHRPEPQLPWAPEKSPVPRTAPPTAPTSAQVPAPIAPSAAAAPFETDAPAAPGQFALPPLAQALLDRAAELLRRPDAPTPFAIGLLAPAGGGKSSALAWLTRKLGGPGAPPVAALRAADLAAEPERALAAALYRALSPAYGPLANEAAQEGAHVGADAGAYARAAHEKLDALRKKLHGERQTLAQTEARRASLAETLLYDTPGSRINSFARRIRAAFEPRLRRFGFSGDSLANFKDLTRDLAETGGPSARIVSSLRALYAFQGQKSLLAYAVLCFILNWAANWLTYNKKAWLSGLASSSTQGAQASEFLNGHVDWLSQAAHGFALLGLVLLGLNVWRAFNFMQPLFYGAGLLDEDIAAKRHELDQTLAHQARSVDLLGAETAAVARQASEAERRADAAGATRHPPAFLEADAATQKRDLALGFLHCLSQLIANGGNGAPPRLVVTVDGFESVAQPAALFDRLHDLLARQGIVAVYALDPEVFAAGRPNLLRRIQLPLRLDAGQKGETVPALAPLDAPFSPLATRLIGAMAPLTGDGPRTQKRLRNLFRFLRPAPEAPKGLQAALALFLAAQLGASPEDRRSLNDALAGDGENFAPIGSATLHEALTNASVIEGLIGKAEARQAAALARHVAG